ncbi:MAG: OadG family protein [Deltaproteobacteria bacterium]|nr:OadG family protein [Deltaproteobacteria bacterium]
MYGLQAIAAYNGWAMALAGALIVFSGLVILSFVISQLHKGTTGRQTLDFITQTIPYRH